MKQKFGKLSFVRVSKDMPKNISHFDKDFDAIIDGTYSQLHGGKDVDAYFLYQIWKGTVVNHRGWYHEAQLTLLPEQDRDKAEEMIEKYNFKNEGG